MDQSDNAARLLENTKLLLLDHEIQFLPEIEQLLGIELVPQADSGTGSRWNIVGSYAPGYYHVSPRYGSRSSGPIQDRNFALFLTVPKQTRIRAVDVLQYFVRSKKDGWSASFAWSPIYDAPEEYSFYSAALKGRIDGGIYINWRELDGCAERIVVRR